MQYAALLTRIHIMKKVVFLLLLILPFCLFSCGEIETEPTGVDLDCLPGRWVIYKAHVNGLLIDNDGHPRSVDTTYEYSSKQVKKLAESIYFQINADGTAANVSGSSRAEWLWTIEDDNTLSLVRTFPHDEPGHEMKGRYIIRFLTQKEMCLFDIGQASSCGGANVTSYYKKMKQ